MSTSSTAPATAAPRLGVTARSGSGRWVGKVVMAIAATLALLVVAFLATMIFGIVMGTEFCPHTFERRGFAFREIPFTGIQISSIDRRTDTGIVELYIIKQGYIVPDQTEPKSWHLLSLRRFRGTYAEGDAELLMKYLDAQNDKEEYAWLKWSEDHPQLAKVLWPAVAKAAQDGNYLIVPDLFTFARSTKDPVKLQKKVDATLAKAAQPVAAKSATTKAAPQSAAMEKAPTVIPAERP
jgi:hypothetical protein